MQKHDLLSGVTIASPYEKQTESTSIYRSSMYSLDTEVEYIEVPKQYDFDVYSTATILTGPYLESTVYILEVNELVIGFSVPYGEENADLSSTGYIPYSSDLASETIIKRLDDLDLDSTASFHIHTNLESTAFIPIRADLDSTAVIPEYTELWLEYKAAQIPLYTESITPVKDAFTLQKKQFLNFGEIDTLELTPNVDKKRDYIVMSLQNLWNLIQKGEEIVSITFEIHSSQILLEKVKFSFLDYTTTWYESGITWANQEEAGALQFDVTIQPSSLLISIDVKDFLLDLIYKLHNDDKDLFWSFQLISSLELIIGSRESLYPPTLVIKHRDPNWVGETDDKDLGGVAIIKRLGDEDIESKVQLHQIKDLPSIAELDQKGNLFDSTVLITGEKGKGDIAGKVEITPIQLDLPSTVVIVASADKDLNSTVYIPYRDIPSIVELVYPFKDISSTVEITLPYEDLSSQVAIADFAMSSLDSTVYIPTLWLDGTADIYNGQSEFEGTVYIVTPDYEIIDGKAEIDESNIVFPSEGTIVYSGDNNFAGTVDLIDGDLNSSVVIQNGLHEFPSQGTISSKPIDNDFAGTVDLIDGDLNSSVVIHIRQDFPSTVDIYSDWGELPGQVGIAQGNLPSVASIWRKADLDSEITYYQPEIWEMDSTVTIEQIGDLPSIGDIYTDWQDLESTAGIISSDLGGIVEIAYSVELPSTVIIHQVDAADLESIVDIKYGSKKYLNSEVFILPQKDLDSTGFLINDTYLDWDSTVKILRPAFGFIVLDTTPPQDFVATLDKTPYENGENYVILNLSTTDIDLSALEVQLKGSGFEVIDAWVKEDNWYYYQTSIKLHVTTGFLWLDVACRDDVWNESPNKYHFDFIYGGGEITPSFDLELDTTAPDVKVTVNDGNPTWYDRNFTFKFECDDLDVSEIKIYGDFDLDVEKNFRLTESGSKWVPYTTEIKALCSAGLGDKTFHIIVRDDVWNEYRLDVTIELAAYRVNVEEEFTSKAKPVVILDGEIQEVKVSEEEEIIVAPDYDRISRVLEVFNKWFNTLPIYHGKGDLNTVIPVTEFIQEQEDADIIVCIDALYTSVEISEIIILDEDSEKVEEIHQYIWTLGEDEDTFDEVAWETVDGKDTDHFWERVLWFYIEYPAYYTSTEGEEIVLLAKDFTELSEEALITLSSKYIPIVHEGVLELQYVYYDWIKSVEEDLINNLPAKDNFSTVDVSLVEIPLSVTYQVKEAQGDKQVVHVDFVNPCDVILIMDTEITKAYLFKGQYGYPPTIAYKNPDYGKYMHPEDLDYPYGLSHPKYGEDVPPTLPVVGASGCLIFARYSYSYWNKDLRGKPSSANNSLWWYYPLLDEDEDYLRQWHDYMFGGEVPEFLVEQTSQINICAIHEFIIDQKYLDYKGPISINVSGYSGKSPAYRYRVPLRAFVYYEDHFVYATPVFYTGTPVYRTRYNHVSHTYETYISYYDYRYTRYTENGGLVDMTWSTTRRITIFLTSWSQRPVQNIFESVSVNVSLVPDTKNPDYTREEYIYPGWRIDDPTDQLYHLKLYSGTDCKLPSWEWPKATTFQKFLLLYANKHHKLDFMYFEGGEYEPYVESGLILPISADEGLHSTKLISDGERWIFADYHACQNILVLDLELEERNYTIPASWCMDEKVKNPKYGQPMYPTDDDYPFRNNPSHLRYGETVYMTILAPGDLQGSSSSGGEGVHYITFHPFNGAVTVSFDAYWVPDKFDVLINGIQVFTTGTIRGTAKYTREWDINTDGSDLVIRVTGPSGTAWNVQAYQKTSDHIIPDPDYTRAEYIFIGDNFAWLKSLTDFYEDDFLFKLYTSAECNNASWDYPTDDDLEKWAQFYARKVQNINMEIHVVGQQGYYNQEAIIAYPEIGQFHVREYIDGWGMAHRVYGADVGTVCEDILRIGTSEFWAEYYNLDYSSNLILAQLKWYHKPKNQTTLQKLGSFRNYAGGVEYLDIYENRSCKIQPWSYISTSSLEEDIKRVINGELHTDTRRLISSDENIAESDFLIRLNEVEIGHVDIGMTYDAEIFKADTGAACTGVLITDFSEISQRNMSISDNSPVWTNPNTGLNILRYISDIYNDVFKAKIYFSSECNKTSWDFPTRDPWEKWAKAFATKEQNFSADIILTGDINQVWEDSEIRIPFIIDLDVSSTPGWEKIDIEKELYGHDFMGEHESSLIRLSDTIDYQATDSLIVEYGFTIPTDIVINMWYDAEVYIKIPLEASISKTLEVLGSDQDSFTEEGELNLAQTEVGLYDVKWKIDQGILLYIDIEAIDSYYIEVPIEENFKGISPSLGVEIPLEETGVFDVWIGFEVWIIYYLDLKLNDDLNIELPTEDTFLSFEEGQIGLDLYTNIKADILVTMEVLLFLYHDLNALFKDNIELPVSDIGETNSEGQILIDLPLGVKVDTLVTMEVLLFLFDEFKGTSSQIIGLPIYEQLNSEEQSGINVALVDIGELETRVEIEVEVTVYANYIALTKLLTDIPVLDTYFSIEEGIVHIAPEAVFEVKEQLTQEDKYDEDFGYPVISLVMELPVIECRDVDEEAQLVLDISYHPEAIINYWIDKDLYLFDEGYVCFWLQIEKYNFVPDWLYDFWRIPKPVKKIRLPLTDEEEQMYKVNFLRKGSCIGSPPGGWPPIRPYPIPDGYYVDPGTGDILPDPSDPPSGWIWVPGTPGTPGVPGIPGHWEPNPSDPPEGWEWVPGEPIDPSDPSGPWKPGHWQPKPGTTPPGWLWDPEGGEDGKGGWVPDPTDPPPGWVPHPERPGCEILAPDFMEQPMRPEDFDYPYKKDDPRYGEEIPKYIEVKTEYYARSGGYGSTKTSYDLGMKPAKVILHYDMYYVPDSLRILYEGETICDTGQVSDEGTIEFEWAPKEGESTEVEVLVVGPSWGTSWHYNFTVYYGTELNPEWVRSEKVLSDLGCWDPPTDEEGKPKPPIPELPEPPVEPPEYPGPVPEPEPDYPDDDVDDDAIAAIHVKLKVKDPMIIEVPGNMFQNVLENYYFALDLILELDEIKIRFIDDFKIDFEDPFRFNNSGMGLEMKPTFDMSLSSALVEEDPLEILFNLSNVLIENQEDIINMRQVKMKAKLLPSIIEFSVKDGDMSGN